MQRFRAVCVGGPWDGRYYGADERLARVPISSLAPVSFFRPDAPAPAAPSVKVGYYHFEPPVLPGLSARWRWEPPQ